MVTRPKRTARRSIFLSFPVTCCVNFIITITSALWPSDWNLISMTSPAASLSRFTYSECWLLLNYQMRAIVVKATFHYKTSPQTQKSTLRKSLRLKHHVVTGEKTRQEFRIKNSFVINFPVLFARRNFSLRMLPACKIHWSLTKKCFSFFYRNIFIVNLAISGKEFTQDGSRFFMVFKVDDMRPFWKSEWNGKLTAGTQSTMNTCEWRANKQGRWMYESRI